MIRDILGVMRVLGHSIVSRLKWGEVGRVTGVVGEGRMVPEDRWWCKGGIVG